MSDIASLATALATVLLVIVTWRYARTTRQMASDAKRSAEAAEKAAKSSSLAAEVAVSNLPVSFYVRPISQVGVEKGTWVGVELQCTESTVYVHAVKLLSYGKALTMQRDAIADHSPFTSPDTLPQDLEITDASFPGRYGSPEVPRSIPELPVRMFKGHAEAFQFPEGADFEDKGLVRIAVLVQFSLAKEGPISSRRAHGRAKDGNTRVWEEGPIPPEYI